MSLRICIVTAAAIALMTLGGCAAGARQQAMTASKDPGVSKPEPGALYAVGGVGGGEETNPLWTSEIDSAAFREALIASMINYGIYDASSDMKVLAILEEVDQPLIGISMTVTSRVNYRVTDEDDQVLFERTVTVPYTAEFSDSFYGVERLRLANEGSARANIDRFIGLLIEADIVEDADVAPGIS